MSFGAILHKNCGWLGSRYGNETASGTVPTPGESREEHKLIGGDAVRRERRV
jgi:hypothetical protein